jgi:hypothetical protein
MIRRNVAGQVIYLPQLTTTDGTPITSSATLTVAKDGTEAASGGTLAHVSNGVWKYTPTQAETDAAIVGLILTGTNAVPVVLNLVTTAADTSAVALGANTVTPTNLSAAQVRTELATELARIDVAISTRSVFNAASDTVTVGTNNDKTGYALTQAFPSNFASLGITGDGYVSRVVLVDTCTANTDMRGTDNALLASSYTAPANGDIAAIKAKTDNLPNDPATIAKQDEILGAIGDIECGGGGGDCGDATEAKQDAILAALTTADIRRVALPIQDCTLAIVQGDTYDDIAQPKARFATERDFTDGWTVVLTIRDKDDAVVYSVAGVVESDESIAIAIAAPTGLPMAGCPGVWEGKFDVEVSKGASVVTIERGPAYVYEDQTR